MTTPHKWAAEIRAMADGKEVEGFLGLVKDGVEVWRLASGEYNPITCPAHQWRIKPEKKTMRYRVALMKADSHSWLGYAETLDDEAGIEISTAFSEWLHDWQEVEVE